MGSRVAGDTLAAVNRPYYWLAFAAYSRLVRNKEVRRRSLTHTDGTCKFVSLLCCCLGVRVGLSAAVRQVLDIHMVPAACHGSDAQAVSAAIIHAQTGRGHYDVLGVAHPRTIMSLGYPLPVVMPKTYTL